MTETEIQQLIIAGSIAFGGIALGLLIGVIRGQGIAERLRLQMTASNEELQLELASATRVISGLEVERNQLQERLQEGRTALSKLENDLDSHG
jgi:DNA recombination protein RmuC